MDVGAVEAPTFSEELNVQAITIIGLDSAQSVFQVQGDSTDIKADQGNCAVKAHGMLLVQRAYGGGNN
jgi:hypothetical protein